MSAYLLKRILVMIPTLLGIFLITFVIVRLTPGDPVTLKIQAAQGLKATALSQEITQQMLKLYGLKVDLPAGYERFIAATTVRIHGSDPKDHPKWTRRVLEWMGQNAIQFRIWMVNITRLNFGVSFKDHRPVLTKIAEALPITITLNLLEFFIAYLVSVPLGVFSALHRDSLIDKSTMITLFILYSLPTFWVAFLLLMLLGGGDYLNLFPLGGLHSEGYQQASFFSRFGDLLWHLVLPVATMTYADFAFITRFSRSTMLEVVKQDYVRTAMAKGLPKRQVVWKHAFRNSLIPQITLLGTLLPGLIGGSVIIEYIFSIPGMGKLAFDSISARDYPTIMAITTITAVLTLVNLLLGDIAYAFVDPRVNFEGKQQR